MYKICIADDEAFVVKSIEKRLALTGLPVRVVGVAGNGIEAFDLYEKLGPDIFLVDVNMPQCDGLEFMERVRRIDENSKTRFIIISGYDDFVYVKKAIQIGVMDYIMKPIIQQEFQETMEKVCQAIREEREQQEELMDRRKDYWEDFPADRGAFQGTAILLYQERLADLLAEAPGECKRIWRRDFPRDRWRTLYFQGSRNVLLLTGAGVEMEEGRIRTVLGALSPWMPMCAAWIWADGQDMTELLRHLEGALNLRFWYGARQMFSADQDALRWPKLNLEQLELSLDNLKERRYEAILEELFTEIFSQREYVPSLLEVHHSIMTLYAGVYMKYKMAIPGNLKEEFGMMALTNCRLQRDILEKWKQYGRILREKMRSLLNRDDVVERIRLYLEQHYQEEIGLAELSGEFFLAPGYMTKRFKEKLGMTIPQYLENYRIEKAKEYLMMTDHSISEIAQTVGYSDANYFARSFRKVCQLSPREFRNGLKR